MKKTDNRNIDKTKARGELEEDLLEFVYRTWRSGKHVTSKEYAREVGITGHESAGLVRSLVTKGFLWEPEKGYLELTEKGQLKGMDCLARHEKLTQFFQMISGMERDEAEEDACRIEHYISRKGLDSIGKFLQDGDVYDRTYEDMDLNSFYEEGVYSMAFGLYEPERRNPRFLAAEYENLQPMVILSICKTGNQFLLRKKPGRSMGYLWYRLDGLWVKAKSQDDVFELPTYIFSYTTNAGIPITEAVAIIAITRFEQEPLPIDYRELNIHVW